MSRLAAVCGVLALGGLLVLGRADSAPPAKQKEPAKPARTEPVGVRLTQTVKFAGFDDPALTLGDALDKLGKAYVLDFKVNEAAFIAEGIADVFKTAITEKPIPKRSAIRLDQLLHLVLGRINSSSGTTFLVRGNSIEVTTNQRVRTQIWGGHNGPFLPLVNRSFAKQPLEDALKALAEQAEYNVVLDNRVGDKAKTPLTARFANTPLDTAVGFLADMADLRPVLLDNVIYVTTRENAALWASRLKKEMTGNPEEVTGPRIGAGVGSPPPPTGMPGA